MRRVVTCRTQNSWFRETGYPGSAASRPVSQRSTDAPTSANGPSWRRPPWPSKRASSGTCSRVWSVPGVVGSQPWSAVMISRSRAGSSRSSQRPDLGVDRLQRAVVARDVVAVAVDLVGLDEVREDEAAVERVDQLGRRRQRGRVGRRPCAGRRRRRRRTPARSCRPCAPARRRTAARPCRSARAAAARGPCARRCARTRPARRGTAARSRGRRRARRT